MTEKLFYEDSHRKEFEAIVLSCEPDGQFYKVVLDKTAFFPEGGGQYADTGTLGDAKVSDVREKDGIIYHKTDCALQKGQTVTGQLDWQERFEKMQQHSGEHIVSGIIHERFGYDNVGFHLASDYCTLDFDGPITKEELEEIEYEANKAVFENVEVTTFYPSKAELEKLQYRSKIEIEGQVRIVSIDGYDVCACCAPHVKYTGEIGLIKLVNMMNYKGGERLTMQCGFRALQDYDGKLEAIKAMSNLLCEKEEQVERAVVRLKEEQGVLKSKLIEQQQRLLAYKAEEIPVTEHFVAVFDREITGNGPRELMNLLLDKGAVVCGVFAGTDEDGYRYVIGSKTEDVRPICKELNVQFAGKGGGKQEMVQGSLQGKQEEIEAVL